MRAAFKYTTHPYRGAAAVVAFACVMCVGNAAAQTAEPPLTRWAEVQRAGIASLQFLMQERSTTVTESASGTRTWTAVARIAADPRTGRLERTMEALSVGDRAISLEELRKRQQKPRTPVRGDLQDASDALLFPHSVLNQLEQRGDPSLEDLDGRQVLRIQTVARRDTTIDHVTWYMDPETRRLLRIRSVIRAPDRGTLVVEVGFEKRGVLDLPVWRTTEGSYQHRRRTRTYTVLVESEATYELLSSESLE